MKHANPGILIVEDQVLVRHALREYLQAAYPSATVMEAHDGASALAACRSERVGLVVSDLGLPDVNGVDLIVAIRAMLPGVPVIVVSQQSEPIYAERSRDAGAYAFVAKHRIHRELLPVVAGALSAAPAGRSQ